MVRSTHKVIKGIIIVFMLLITIFNIYNIVNTKVLNKDLTILDDRAIISMNDESMKGTLSIGDLVIIRTNDYNYKPGDIVTYKDSNNNYVTKRIVTINGNEVITKGDNSNTLNKISIEKIIGKYVRRIGLLGYVLNAFTNTSLLVVVIVLGTLICLLLSFSEYEEKERLEEKRKEDEYRTGENKDIVKAIRSTNKSIGKLKVNKSDIVLKK